MSNLQSGSEDGGLSEELGDDEAEEAQHGDAPIPALGAGREGPKTAGIIRLALDDGHDRSVREQLHDSQEVEEARLASARDLLLDRQAGHALRHHGPREAQHGQAAVDGLGRGAVEREDAEEGLAACLRTPLHLRTRPLPCPACHWVRARHVLLSLLRNILLPDRRLRRLVHLATQIAPHSPPQHQPRRLTARDSCSLEPPGLHRESLQASEHSRSGHHHGRHSLA